MKRMDVSVGSLGEVIRLFAPSMDDYLYVLDFKEDFYQISPSAVQRFKLPAEQFYQVTDKITEFMYPGDVPMLQKELQLMMEGSEESHDLCYRWLGRDGQPIWINCRGRVIRDEDGSPHYLVGCINEIGQKQMADNVSGLLGEAGFKAFYKAFGRNVPEGFLLRIGIDDFKDINENYGMDYGDFILRKMAECIEGCVSRGQYLFRMVADEFVVMDVEGGTEEDARALYHQIRLATMELIERCQYKAVYTISGGILFLEKGDACSYDTAIKLSEFALSEAKRRGKNMLYVYEQSTYEAYLDRQRLLRKFHQSVSKGCEGFALYYQPIVEAESGDLIGAEALLRYMLPDGTCLSPAYFIPILEESGYIIPVGRWVLAQALATCRSWQQYLPKFKINVNLSYIQVTKSDILPEIINQVNLAGVAPHSLCIELTESGYFDENQQFSEVWNGLRGYGIQLAIDDFGTGYSNLRSLCDLKPTYVKIDRTFIAKACTQKFEFRLLSHVVEMAHSLGLLVCTEGIETEEELAKISRTKPDAIQGYLFGKPCSQTTFEKTFFWKESGRSVV